MGNQGSELVANEDQIGTGESGRQSNIRELMGENMSAAPRATPGRTPRRKGMKRKSPSIVLPEQLRLPSKSPSPLISPYRAAIVKLTERVLRTMKPYLDFATRVLDYLPSRKYNIYTLAFIDPRKISLMETFMMKSRIDMITHIEDMLNEQTMSLIEKPAEVDDFKESFFNLMSRFMPRLVEEGVVGDEIASLVLKTLTKYKFEEQEGQIIEKEAIEEEALKAEEQQVEELAKKDEPTTPTKFGTPPTSSSNPASPTTPIPTITQSEPATPTSPIPPVIQPPSTLSSFSTSSSSQVKKVSSPNDPKTSPSVGKISKLTKFGSSLLTPAKESFVPEPEIDLTKYISQTALRPTFYNRIKNHLSQLNITIGADYTIEGIIEGGNDEAIMNFAKLIGRHISFRDIEKPTRYQMLSWQEEIADVTFWFAEHSLDRGYKTPITVGQFSGFQKSIQEKTNIPRPRFPLISDMEEQEYTNIMEKLRMELGDDIASDWRDYVAAGVRRSISY
jgi:hypothetical protein